MTVTWPFRSAAVRILERDKQLLQERLRDFEARLAEGKDRELYWRTRYERLADLILVRNGEARGAVHESPPESTGLDLGTRVARVASLVGSHQGIKREPAQRSAAELPIELVERR